MSVPTGPSRILAGAPRALCVDFRLEATPAPCGYDINHDDPIALIDLAILLTNSATAAGAIRATGDTNDLDDVDLADLASPLANLGASWA